MRHLVIALAGLLGGSVPATTQQQPPRSAYGETVQVTATLAEEPTTEVAAAVAVVSAEEAEARQAESVLELLATLPGLATTQSGSPGKAASLFSRGTGSNHTLVLRDGVRLNDPFLGGYDWAFDVPAGLERVESVRGPFSALYGSGAVGGVIQLVTRNRPGLTARIEGGSRELLRASLAGAEPVGPLLVSGSGVVRRGEGVVDNDFFDGEQVALRLEHRTREGEEESPWRLGLAVRWHRATLGLPYDFFGQPSPQQRQEGETRQLALPFGWQSHGLSVDGSVARVDQDLAVSDVDNPFAASASEAASEQARFVVRGPFGERLSWAAGGDWERQRATSSSAFGSGLRDDQQRSTGLFALATWQGERTRWEAGLRRDENDVFGGATSFRGGGTIRLGAHLTARASYGEAFRAPSLADLYYPGFGNPELTPERSRGGELGVEATPGPWRLSVTLFETRLGDLVQYDFLRGKPFNTGRARTRGLEAEASLRRASFWLRSAGTYLEANDIESGDRLLRRPRLTGSLAVGGELRSLSLHAILRHVGDRVDVGAAELPAYTVLDAGLAWAAGGTFSPYFRVENLLDRQYEEAAGFPAPGRAYVAGLALTLAR